MTRDLAELPPVSGDRDALLPRVHNLVTNAVEAVEGEGAISVRTYREGGSAVFSIADSGCGMSAEYMRKRLFTPFQSTKKGGWGIGLYHSKGIVEAHGGRIDVESRHGESTTFRVATADRPTFPGGAPEMTRPAEALSWTPAAWLWLLLPGALAVGLYGQLVPALVQEWSEFPTLSHGFAIPVIAGYLLWTRREQVRAAVWAPSLVGLPVLLLGLVAFTMGMRGDEIFLARLSLPVTLLGLSLFLGGWQFTRAVWVGIAYLAFMVPAPYSTLRILTQRSRLLEPTPRRRSCSSSGCRLPGWRDAAPAEHRARGGRRLQQHPGDRRAGSWVR